MTARKSKKRRSAGKTRKSKIRKTTRRKTSRKKTKKAKRQKGGDSSEKYTFVIDSNNTTGAKNYDFYINQIMKIAGISGKVTDKVNIKKGKNLDSDNNPIESHIAGYSNFPKKKYDELKSLHLTKNNISGCETSIGTNRTDKICFIAWSNMFKKIDEIEPKYFTEMRSGGRQDRDIMSSKFVKLQDDLSAIYTIIVVSDNLTKDKSKNILNSIITQSLTDKNIINPFIIGDCGLEANNIDAIFDDINTERKPIPLSYYYANRQKRTNDNNTRTNFIIRPVNTLIASVKETIYLDAENNNEKNYIVRSLFKVNYPPKFESTTTPDTTLKSTKSPATHVPITCDPV